MSHQHSTLPAAGGGAGWGEVGWGEDESFGSKGERENTMEAAVVLVFAFR